MQQRGMMQPGMNQQQVLCGVCLDGAAPSHAPSAAMSDRPSRTHHPTLPWSRTLACIQQMMLMNQQRMQQQQMMMMKQQQKQKQKQKEK